MVLHLQKIIRKEVINMACPICGGRLENENPLGMTSHIVCDTCSYVQTADGYPLSEYMKPEDVTELIKLHLA